MKYVLLGTLSTDWAVKHGQRIESSTAKLAGGHIQPCSGDERHCFRAIPDQPLL